MMTQWAFINGEFMPKGDASVSVYDHGLLYGDGVFEGIRAYDGVVFKLQEHLERLYDSAKSILLNIPYTLEELQNIILDILRRNELETSYIRVVVTRGIGDLGLNPFTCGTPQVIVLAEQLAMFPKELYEKGIEIVSVATRRNRADILSPKVKSLNYLNNILIKIEAHNAGVSEALTLNTEGYVAEGSGENVFVVNGTELLTPPSYLGALEGITRAAVMDIARELDYTVKEAPFTRHDVYTADEVFMTGTAAEIVPIVKVDGRQIGNGVPGYHTHRLLRAFQEVTKRDGVRVYPESPKVEASI